MSERPKCCICGRTCEDKWGNNPWPLGKEDEVCCNVCNILHVIPARMKDMKKR